MTDPSGLRSVEMMRFDAVATQAHLNDATDFQAAFDRAAPPLAGGPWTDFIDPVNLEWAISAALQIAKDPR